MMMHGAQHEQHVAAASSNNNDVYITTDQYQQQFRPQQDAPYPHPYPPPLPHPPPPPHKSKQTPVYTYYYLGRHLWYIPLYFSIYFIVYVGLLVLKSIARHKIQFPQNLHEAATTREQHVLRSIEEAGKRYFM
ncbi:hypothetical protein O3M35_009013 [Rhynocoris fuscipes]|uniref:Uncharacterized protein n=1 Tax=Rhynocoris fuscipes TaxID=488301 RepID=A0AAW1D448_9HEMI